MLFNKVFESRDEIEQETFARKLIAPVETVCMTPSEYHGLISAVIFLMVLLFSITMAAGLVYRRVLFYIKIFLIYLPTH